MQVIEQLISSGHCFKQDSRDGGGTIATAADDYLMGSDTEVVVRLKSCLVQHYNRE